MCLAPRLIHSKAKDAFDSGVKEFPVPCGKCVECLQDKQNAWIYRLFNEQNSSKHSLFVTLTYDPANLPLMVNGKIEPYKDYIRRKSIEDCCITLNPRDLQLYFKRLRKATNVKFKYFACGEYGSDGRPHYHFAIFYNDGEPEIVEHYIDACWNKGFTEIDPLIQNRIVYLTKYITDKVIFSRKDDRAVEYFNRVSHGMGIDGFFCDEQHYGVGFKITILPNGTVIPVPRYFTRKYYPKNDFLTLSIFNQNDAVTKRHAQAVRRIEQDRKISHCDWTSEAVHEYALNRTSDETRRRVLEQVKRRKADF